MLVLVSYFTNILRNRFGLGDKGATAVEYGLMVGLIAVVIIAAVAALGGQLNDMFVSIKNSLVTKA